ncbi:hypothetical protein BGW80DRAFT_1463724 [Lactifluus volemus]|nr:hypothetical protein BGW80DRAFT_1463724 [Lactifluus volemus]
MACSYRRCKGVARPDRAKEFRGAFPDSSIPSLPQLLATISGASSMRDLLVTLHLRVRTVVPATLKARARRRRDEQRDRGWHTEEEGAFRSRSRRRHKQSDLELFDPSPAWYMRRNAGAVEPPILDEGIDLDEEIEKEEAEEAEAEAEEASPGEKENGTSVVTDPFMLDDS